MIEFTIGIFLFGIPLLLVWYFMNGARKKNEMKSFICPNANCGYHGAPTKKSKGNVFVGLFLCLFWLLPGIIYFIIKDGFRYSCPKCHLEILKTGLIH